MTYSSVINVVRTKMVGRIAMTDPELELLCKYASLDGDHLEIGTLYGGTAILAWKVKEEGKIWCIDPFTGYYGRGADPVPDYKHLTPSLELFEDNLDRLDADPLDFMIFDQVSIPNPVPFGQKFTSILLDGDHQNGTPQNEVWEYAYKAPYILLHNYEPKYPDVMAAAHLLTSGGYMVGDKVDSLIVMERIRK